MRFTATYHNPAVMLGGETGEIELAAHHGQECEVLAQLGWPEVDVDSGIMYRVRFADGYQSDVFADEIDPEETYGT